MIFISTLLLFLGQTTSALAQDSLWTVGIDSVMVKSTRLATESIGTKIYSVPSIQKITNSSVGDALAFDTPISFRQYGPGMLQSASARGTGAGHLGVNWNGINIQSMTHGQVDFGLIGLSENITYIPGGNSTMDGSGNLGGLVRLDTRLRHANGLHGSVSGSLASFHNQQFRGNIHWTQTSWASLTEINYKDGKNDFPFVNTTSVGHPTQIQANNGYNTLNFRQSNQWILNPKNVVAVHYWLTKSHREIPASMTSANDFATQDDQFHRLLADWTLALKNHISIKTKLANINEQLDFKNQILFSHTATTKQILDSRLSFKKNTINLLSGMTLSREKAFADGYGQSHQRVTSALFLAGNKQLNPDWVVAVQTRLETKDFGRWIPIYSVATAYNRTHFGIKGKFGKHFHTPTFNDLFWLDLGVPDLKDEVGYQGEATVSYKYQNTTNRFSTAFTGYWLSVQDWILWAPDNLGTWHPSNSKKVVSSGIESNLSYRYHHKLFSASGKLGYTLVRSINKESNHTQDIIGKQLIYVPKHKANGQASLAYDHLGITYEWLFVGQSPYTQNNSKYIPSYSIQNIHFVYTPTITKMKFKFHFSIANLTNKNYQTIRFRPMPGRSFDGGLKLLF